MKHGNCKVSSDISIRSDVAHVDFQILASVLAKGVAGVAERERPVGDVSAPVRFLAGEDLGISLSVFGISLFKVHAGVLTPLPWLLPMWKGWFSAVLGSPIRTSAATIITLAFNVVNHLTWYRQLTSVGNLAWLWLCSWKARGTGTAHDVGDDVSTLYQVSSFFIQSSTAMWLVLLLTWEKPRRIVLVLGQALAYSSTTLVRVPTPSV